MPSISTQPLVVESSPARMCISVDLPDPDGPMIAVNEPRSKSTETPRSASTAAAPSPKRLVISWPRTTTWVSRPADACVWVGLIVVMP